MCDMRSINQIEVDGIGVLDVRDSLLHCQAWDPSGEDFYDKVTEQGFYRIAASGGGYGYFDGRSWRFEGNGLKVLSYDEFNPIGCHTGLQFTRIQKA